MCGRRCALLVDLPSSEWIDNNMRIGNLWGRLMREVSRRGESEMPKNILIFSDGTGQAGGLTPDQNVSNIYKLYRATRCGPENDIDPSQQLTFYSDGMQPSTQLRTKTASHSCPLA